MSPVRLLLALTVPLTVLFGIHYYLWARLVRDTGLQPPWRTVATVTLALLGLAIVGSLVVMRFAPRAVSSPLAWLGYSWIGVAVFTLTLLAATDLLRLILHHTVSPAPVDAERRAHLARLAGFAVGAGALGLSAVAGRGATAAAVTVKRLKIALGKLDPAMAGLRIVQISDVHVGPTIGRAFVEDIVRRVNELEPDVVAITGDLIDGTVEQLGELVAPLGQLRAKHGVFFTTGNHEYYWPTVEGWLAHLGTLGIRVLRNERVRIGGERGFDLAGIDDASAKSYGHGHGADLDKALAGRDPNRAVVLLAHHPKQVADAQRLEVDLQLSGHIHGGQFFPFSVLVWLAEPYFAGLYTLDKTQLYVSRGTGYWGPPMRLGSPAEITVLELNSPSPSTGEREG
jgi:predicted MPP superfamily phosphohydrolase